MKGKKKRQRKIIKSSAGYRIKVFGVRSFPVWVLESLICFTLWGTLVLSLVGLNEGVEQCDPVQDKEINS